MTRWATFDCYGTLIDWNGGIGGVLEHLFGAERTPDLLARYHRLEPEVQAETYRSYAEVLTLTLERLVSETGLSIPEGESGVLVHSLPEWPPFRVPGHRRCGGHRRHDGGVIWTPWPAPSSPPTGRPPCLTTCVV